MKQYHDYLQHILEHGAEKRDRTGTGTLSVFGYQMRFDLAKGFPLLTTKRVPFRHAAEEILWMLRGETNIRPLVEKGVHVWTDWPLREWAKASADELRRFGLELPVDAETGRIMTETDQYRALRHVFETRITDESDFAARWGDLGPVYGAQWRHAMGRDQVEDVLRLLRESPDSRRMIITAWNPDELDDMALPPCHMTMQFYTRELTYMDRLRYKEEKWQREQLVDTDDFDSEEKLDRQRIPRRALSLQLYMRSNDAFLGAPWNIAQYALLAHLFAHETGMAPGELVYTVGDCHLYLNHLDQARELLAREPRPLPHLKITRRAGRIDAYTPSDFELLGYDPYPAIHAPVAV